MTDKDQEIQELLKEIHQELELNYLSVDQLDAVLDYIQSMTQFYKDREETPDLHFDY